MHGRGVPCVPEAGLVFPWDWGQHMHRDKCPAACWVLQRVYRKGFLSWGEREGAWTPQTFVLLVEELLVGSWEGKGGPLRWLLLPLLPLHPEVAVQQPKGRACACCWLGSFESRLVGVRSSLQDGLDGV